MKSRYVWAVDDLVITPLNKSKASRTVSKASVNYRPAISSEKCGNCSMFRLHAESGACTLVEGRIDEDYTCDRWEPTV